MTTGNYTVLMVEALSNVSCSWQMGVTVTGIVSLGIIAGTWLLY